jgi:transposase
MICVVRMGSDQRTRSYLARRLAEGKSKWEIMRCLKRYIAREVYGVLVSSAAAEPPPIGITEPVLGADIA